MGIKFLKEYRFMNLRKIACITVVTCFPIFLFADGNKLPESGYIGIGDSTPSYQLDVNGYVNLNTGTTQLGNTVPYTYGDRTYPYTFEGGSYAFLTRGVNWQSIWGIDRTNLDGNGNIVPVANGDILWRVRVSGSGPNGNNPQEAPIEVKVFGEPTNDVIPQQMRIYGNTLTALSSAKVGVNQPNPLYNLDVNGSVRLGGFNTSDSDQWPRVIWLRETGSGWDEGLIKSQSSRSVFNRSGFGIHMSAGRQFSFFSSGWNQLFSIKGGSGDTYIKGNVGIGAVPGSGNALDVNGTIRAKEIIVESDWADFVFDEDYKLPSLSEVETHIAEFGHLPGIPSEEDVQEQGVSLGEMNARLLQKVEELTLYALQQEETISELKAQNQAILKKLEELGL